MGMISQVIRSVGPAVGTVATAVSDVASFTGKATTAHYNVLGQYTFESIPGQSLKDLGNPVGQLALTIIPLIPIVYLLAVTLIPLIGNSLQSIPTGFHLVLNSAYFLVNAQWETLDDDRNLLRHIYGLPGLVLGGAVGLIPAVLYLASMCLVHTLKTAYYTTWSVKDFLTTAYDAQSDYQYYNGDTRVLLRQKYGCGLLGLPVALLLGTVAAFFVHVCRVIRESGINFWRDFTLLINLALPDNDAVPRNFTKRATWQQCYGIVGTLLAIILSIPAVAIIFAGRIITNSVKTFPDACKEALGYFGIGPGFSDDQSRSGMERYGFGLPGAVLGLLIGLIGGIFYKTAEWLHANLRHVANVAAVLINCVLPKNQRSELRPTITLLESVMYFPATGIGAVLGSIGAAFVMLVRLITNNAKSARFAFQFMVNLALEKENSRNRELSNKDAERDSFLRFIGRPGFLLGGALGVLVYLAIHVCRFLVKVAENSSKIALKIMNFIIGAVLADEDKERLRKVLSDIQDFDHIKSPCLGVVGGTLVGLPFGLGGAAIALIVRLISNNGKTFLGAYAHVANLTLPKCLQRRSKYLASNDQRYFMWKWVWSAPGLMMGALVGAVVGFIPGIIRIIKNIITQSVLSGRMVFDSIVPPVESWLRGRDPDSDSEYTKSQNTEIRNYFNTYIVGLPGILLGFGFSVIAVTFYAVRQFIHETYESYSFLSTWLDSFIYDDEIENHNLPEDHDEPRTMIRQFLGGLLGFPLALIHGLISVCVQTLKNTMPSFLSLSGALINVGRGGKIFPTLNEDHRSTKEKAFGVFGYALAVAISGPLALMVFGGRMLKNILLIGLCILASPVTIFFKILGTCCCDNNLDASDQLALKQLYSSRDESGVLTKKINTENPSFEDSWPRVAVKCFTLNVRSLHEEVLDIFRDNHGDDEKITSEIKKLKKDSLYMWMTQQEKEQAHADINAAQVYIRKYMKSPESTRDDHAPAVSSDNSPTLASLFWGVEQSPVHDGRETRYEEGEIITMMA